MKSLSSISCGAPRARSFAGRAAAAAVLSLALGLRAQPSSAPNAAANDDVVKLSEFQVSTSADKGYRAGNSVSATRFDAPIKDLPFAISAFTSQFIADIGARDLWDVVQYAPGVTSAGREFNAGNSIYTIRGFDQAPQHNGFTVQEAYVDTLTVDRVEVVKGPASVLYGQVAPGGTVNYITKRPGAKPFAVWNGQVGSYDYWRTSLDLNQPLAKDKLLFRMNASWENGLEYITPGRQRTRVLAPVLTWRISERVALTVDYQWFSRRENPPSAHFKPNIEIVALPPASGVLGTAGVLVRPDNTDFSFLGYYPLPRNFNYESANDYRRSDFENLNAEFTAKLTDAWTARANFNWSKRRVAHKLTGLGAVSVTVPASYYPAGATLPISAANYALAAQAFANDLLNNPGLAATAPQAQLPRRKRLQEDFGQAKASQVEIVGSFKPGDVKLRPLFGAFYSEGRGYSRQRQTATAQFFPAWDMKNPATWDYTTDYDPATLPVSTNNRSITRNSAGYGVLNASFLGDRLSAVAGVRYNKSSGSTDNFLTPASSLAKVSSNKTTPQIGAGWKVTRDFMVYASYSQSYVLNAAALQFQGVPSGPAAPTTSKGYEVGIKTDFLNGRVSSTIAAYRIDQQDRILRFNSFNATGQTVTNNLQGTLDRSNGIEAEVTWSPRDNWQVYASGALDDIRVKQVPAGEEIFLGTHPEASVKALANLWTRYTFSAGSWKGLWVGAGFNYSGKKAQRVNNPKLFLPEETLWNSAIGYDWKWEGHAMNATLNWQNMANREYFPANQQRGYPSRVTLALTAKY
jgi:iron complex outermembrane recepter protein